MEILVFETALGHTAFARQAATGAPLSGRSASAGRWGRLLALTFGHASERAALRALALRVAKNSTTSTDAQNGDRQLRIETRQVKTGTTPHSTAWNGAVELCSVNQEGVDTEKDELVVRLCAFAQGEAENFDDLEIDASHLTPFGRRVTAACRQIGWGERLTYGELARRAGRPGAARAVGSIMARNRIPLIVPCHRVVPAAGGLGGFSAPQGVAMKRRLLELEQRASTLAK